MTVLGFALPPDSGEVKNYLKVKNSKLKIKFY
jgi:hypothetical protein